MDIDGQVLLQHNFSQANESLSVQVLPGQGCRKLSIVRYGKTESDTLIDADGKILQDQMLEIKSVKINGAVVPYYIFQQHSRFESSGQIFPGSIWFGPNGVWTFEFCEPLVTWLLDQKIYQEAKYNKDFDAEWSWKFGPDSVNRILDKIEITRQKIEQLNLQ
jgi:hypothetical protein